MYGGSSDSPPHVPVLGLALAVEPINPLNKANQIRQITNECHRQTQDETCRGVTRLSESTKTSLSSWKHDENTDKKKEKPSISQLRRQFIPRLYLFKVVKSSNKRPRSRSWDPQTFEEPIRPDAVPVLFFCCWLKKRREKKRKVSCNVIRRVQVS